MFSSYLFKNRYFSDLQHHICCCGDDCDVANGDVTSLTTSQEGQEHEVGLCFSPAPSLLTPFCSSLFPLHPELEVMLRSLFFLNLSSILASISTCSRCKLPLIRGRTQDRCNDLWILATLFLQLHQHPLGCNCVGRIHQRYKHG